MAEISNRSTQSAELFVYGTLLQESNSEMAAFMKQHARDLGKGYFYGKLYDLGEYPGAIAVQDAAHKVFGHIYLLQNAPAVLPVLDAYEGSGPGFPEPYLFIRAKVVVYSLNTAISCWTYLFNGPVTESARIASGDYIEHLYGHDKIS